MSKKEKRAKRSDARAVAEQPGGGLGGLGAALATSGFAASKPAPEAPSPTRREAGSSADPNELRGKVVVRQERKGRGGKTVTVISGAAITRVADLAGLAKRLRKALGTGARVENGQIVVQGDQRESAGAWLTRQGAKVTVGN